MLPMTPACYGLVGVGFGVKRKLYMYIHSSSGKA